MSITNWPAAMQPREKLLELGASALTDAELLAIFLRTGTKGYSAIDIGQQLLSTFGSIHGILHAKSEQLLEAKGVGDAKYCQLIATLEIASRHFQYEIEQQPALNSPEAVWKLLASHLENRPAEVFAVLFLDNQHHLIKYHELFHGTIDGASVYPREVVRQCLENNSAAVICAHNHPSGIAEPSQADIQITHRLKKALALVDIRLLDHFIIGRGQYTSLANRGEI